jgi:hypothetical protein
MSRDLSSEMGSLAASPAFVGARKVLLAILDSILAKPDEQKLRRLKPQHSALKVCILHTAPLALSYDAFCRAL